MLTKVVVFSGLLAVVLSASVQEPVAILTQNSDIHPDGAFQWAFEAADGTKQEQSGVPKPIDKEVAEVVQGAASWKDPDGGNHEIKYIADENGFQPVGADIPVTPEIPIQISRALEWAIAHPYKEE